MHEKKKKILLWLWCAVYMLLSVYNTGVGLNLQKQDHGISEELYQECMDLAAFTADCDGDNFVILHGNHFGALWTYNAGENVYFASGDIVSRKEGIDLSAHETVPAICTTGILPMSEYVISLDSARYICVPYEYRLPADKQDVMLVKDYRHLELYLYEIRDTCRIPAVTMR